VNIYSKKSLFFFQFPSVTISFFKKEEFDYLLMILLYRSDRVSKFLRLIKIQEKFKKKKTISDLKLTVMYNRIVFQKN